MNHLGVKIDWTWLTAKRAVAGYFTLGRKQIDQIDAWLESPSLVLLSEDAAHWQRLRALVRSAKVAGPRIHDARIAAICDQNGISELWTIDRDFSRFPDLRVHNPLRTV